MAQTAATTTDLGDFDIANAVPDDFGDFDFANAKPDDLGDFDIANAVEEEAPDARQSLIPLLGTGEAAKRMAGVPTGTIEGAKDWLSAVNDPTERAVAALAARGGDIEGAIEDVKGSTAIGSTIARGAREVGSRMLGGIWGAENILPGEKFATDPRPDAVKRLEDIRDALDKAGVPKDRRRSVLSDAAKMAAWTENDTDKVRKLEAGQLVINPGQVFGDKEAVLKAIESSDASPQEKSAAVKRLDAMREAMVDPLKATLTGVDGGFENFFDREVKKANAETGKPADHAAIMDKWMTTQGDRNMVYKSADALRSGVLAGGLGIAKTVVGTVAGLGDKTVPGYVLNKLTGGRATEAAVTTQQDLSTLMQRRGEAEKTRGLEGGYQLASEFASTVTQMAPMFVGGPVGVYGWAFAQGYESKLDDAFEMQREATGGELDTDELKAAMSRPEVQIGAIANGVQTMALARMLGGGVERAALGQAAKSMTVRDFLSRGGRKALQDSTFKRELGRTLRTMGADFADEAVEEMLNQIIDIGISETALGKATPLGQIVEDVVKAGVMGGLAGGALPQIMQGKGEAKPPPPEIEDAQTLVDQAMPAAPAAGASAQMQVDAAAEAAPTPEPPAPAAPTPRNEKAASLISKLLVKRGVSEDHANRFAALHADELSGLTNAEELRSEVFRRFEAMGGVYPASVETKPTDVDAWRSIAATEEEAQTHATNAKLSNEALVNAAHASNEAALSKPAPTPAAEAAPTPAPAPAPSPLSPEGIKLRPTKDLLNDGIRYRDILRLNVTDDQGQENARIAQEGLDRIRAELDRRKNDPNFVEPISPVAPAPPQPQTPQTDATQEGIKPEDREPEYQQTGEGRETAETGGRDRAVEGGTVEEVTQAAAAVKQVTVPDDVEDSAADRVLKNTVGDDGSYAPTISNKEYEGQFKKGFAWAKSQWGDAPYDTDKWERFSGNIQGKIPKYMSLVPGKVSRDYAFFKGALAWVRELNRVEYDRLDAVEAARQPSPAPTAQPTAPLPEGPTAPTPGGGGATAGPETTTTVGFQELTKKVQQYVTGKWGGLDTAGRLEALRTFADNWIGSLGFTPGGTPDGELEPDPRLGVVHWTIPVGGDTIRLNTVGLKSGTGTGSYADIDKQGRVGVWISGLGAGNVSAEVASEEAAMTRLAMEINRVVDEAKSLLAESKSVMTPAEVEAALADIISPPPIDPLYEGGEDFDPDKHFRLTHAATDAMRVKMGYPPRWGPARVSHGSLFDRVMRAEENWRSKNKGPEASAGERLLNRLMSEPMRPLKDIEIAHLVHEALRLEEAVEAAANAVNEIPDGKDPKRLEDATGKLAKANEALIAILDFTDRRKTLSGQSLAAWKYTLRRDMTLGSQSRVMLATINATRLAQGLPKRNLTSKEMSDLQAYVKAAADAQAEVQQVREELAGLAAENTSLAARIERLEKEAEAINAVEARKTKPNDVLRKVDAWLDNAAERARQRIRERGRTWMGTQEGGGPTVLHSTAANLALEEIRDLAIVMASWLGKKGVTSIQLLNRLKLEFGAAVEAYFDPIKAEAEKLRKYATASAEGGGLKTPEDVMDEVGEGVDEVSRRLVYDLARAHALEGKRGMEIMDAVTETLKTAFPEITREEVTQKFTNYGVVSKAADEPSVEQFVARARRLELIRKKMESIQSGRLPKKTGRIPLETTPEERQAEKAMRNEYRKLEDQLREDAAALGIELVTDSDRLATKLRSAERRMTNEIEELEAAIKAVEEGADPAAVAVVRTKSGLEYTEALQAVRQRLRDTREAYNAIFGKTAEETAEERTARLLKHLDARIQEESELIAEGLLKRAGTPKPDDHPSVIDRRRLLADMRQFKRDLYEIAHPGEMALEQAYKAAEKALANRQAMLAAGVPRQNKPPKTFTPTEDLKNLWSVIDALDDKIREIRRNRPLLPREAQARLDRDIRQATARRDLLKSRVYAADLRTNPPKAVTDARLLAIRNESKDLRREITAMQKERKLGQFSDAARLARKIGEVDSRIKEVERRIREKDFEKREKPKPSRVTSAELVRKQAHLAKVEAELRNHMAERAIAELGPIGLLSKRLADVLRLRIQFMLGGDIGMVNRQLGAVTRGAGPMFDTIKAVGFLVKSLQGKKPPTPDFLLPRILKAVAQGFRSDEGELKHWDDLTNRPNYDKYVAEKMSFISPHEGIHDMTDEQIRSNLLKQFNWKVFAAIGIVSAIGTNMVPLMAGVFLAPAARIALTGVLAALSRPTLLAIERANRVLTNEHRYLLRDEADMFLELLRGDPAEPDTFGRDVTATIMDFTGRAAPARTAPGRALEAALPFLGYIFYAIRWRLSRLNMLTLRPITRSFEGTLGRREGGGGLDVRLPSREQTAALAMASSYYLSYAVGMNIVLTILSSLLGDYDPEDEQGLVTDMADPDFGQVRYGRMKLNVFSGLPQLFRVFYILTGGDVLDPKTGRIHEPSSYEKSRALNRYFSSGMNPNTRLAWDTVISQRYFDGGKFEDKPWPEVSELVTGEITQSLLVRDAELAIQEFGPVMGPVVMTAIYFGDGASFNQAAKMEAAQREAERRERELIGAGAVEAAKDE